MAITFVNKGTFVSGTGALTVTVPASYAAGDLLIIMVESENQNIAMTTGGWTQVTNSPQGTGTAAAAGAVRLACFYKFASASESSAVVADSGDHTSAIMSCWRGVDTTTPFNATAGSVNSSATASLSCPTITTTVANCMIINAIALDKDLADTDTLSAWANASLVSITERHDQSVTAGDGGGIAFASGIKTTAGVVSATTATGDTSTTHAYLTMALTPKPESYSGSSSINQGSILSATNSINKLIANSINQASSVNAVNSIAKTGIGSIEQSSSIGTTSFKTEAVVTNVVLDSYTGLTNSGNTSFGGGQTNIGHSFKPSQSTTINSVSFKLSTPSTPSEGMMFAWIYNCANAIGGGDDKASGSMLAMSDWLNSNVVTGVDNLITFNFSGNNIITVDSANTYVVAVYYEGVNLYFNVIYPHAHTGNVCMMYNGVWYSSDFGMYFSVNHSEVGIAAEGSCSVNQGQTVVANGNKSISKVNTISQASTVNATKTIAKVTSSAIAQPSTLQSIYKIIKFKVASVSQSSTVNATGVREGGYESYSGSCVINQPSLFNTLGTKLSVASPTVNQSSSVQTSIYKIVFGQGSVNTTSSASALGIAEQPSEERSGSCVLSQSSIAQANGRKSANAIVTVSQSSTVISIGLKQTSLTCHVSNAQSISAQSFKTIYTLASIAQSSRVHASRNAPMSKKNRFNVAFVSKESATVQASANQGIIVQYEKETEGDITMSSPHREEIKL